MHQMDPLEVTFDQDFAANSLFARRIVQIQAEILALRQRVAELEVRESLTHKKPRGQMH